MRFGRDTHYILGGAYCNTHIHETGYQIPGKRIKKNLKLVGSAVNSFHLLIGLNDKKIHYGFITNHNFKIRSVEKKLKPKWGLQGACNSCALEEVDEAQLFAIIE